MFAAKTVVEDDRVSEFIAANKQDHPRIEDVFEAIKWSLARGPEDGYQINGFWLMKSYPWPYAPCLIVMYEIEDHQVVITDINFGAVDPKVAPADSGAEG